jgi:thiamine kinase-like enzyme
LYSFQQLATAKPVFDHLDWTPSNVIVHPNGDYVAGIIDWEYAAFIPDPADYFLRGITEERSKKEDWWSLFDGVANIKGKK